LRKISQALTFSSATPGLLRCEGHLTNGQSEKSKNKEPDYDALLHRRKGSSGTEFAGVGLQFAVTIVLFALAGIWLDKRLGTSPWLLLLMVFGGAGLGFWSMYAKMMGKRERGRGKP
jgi:F0F1-type ATP synthase assembly protein I